MSTADHADMVGKTVKRRTPQRPVRQLYIGAWIRALGMRQREVANGLRINEGYLSELISGGKKNPSASLLTDIADFLEIPVSYLYRPPPDQEFIQEAASLDPAVLSRLRTPKH